MANAKIMIVESNASVAEDIAERLKTLGYTVYGPVSSKAQAIAKAAEMRPDLALINTEVERELDGIEIAQEVHNRFDIPVVYLTNYVDEDLLAKVKITRAFGHVFKPYSTNQLHLSIENHLYWHKEDSKFKDREQWLSTVLNSIGDAVIAMDKDGFVTFMNPVAECLTGWQLEKAAGVCMTDVFNVSIGEPGRSIRTLLMSVLHNGTIINRGLSTVDHNVILIAKSGQKISIDYNAAPLRDKQKNITGVVVAFRDVTLHKEAGIKLEQTVAKLQNQTCLMNTVFDSMSDGIVVLDLSGQVLFINPSIQQIFGTEPPEAPPSKWSENRGILYPDKETPVPIDQLLLTHISRGKAVRDQEVFVRNEEHPEGIHIMANGIPLFDENQEVVACVCVVRDITKDKIAEMQLEQTIQELQNQTQLMDTIFNSINDGVVVTDEAGNFLLVNPSAERIVGMGPTDTPPDQWSEAYGTFYPDKVTLFPSNELPLVHAMQGRVTDEVDLFIRNQENPDGCFINVTGRPLQDRRNKVRGGVIVFRDVTKTKSTEAELEQTVKDLKNQTQLLETVFNSMSDGVLVADGNGEYIMANPAAKKMIGDQHFNELNLSQSSEQYGLFDPATGSLFTPDQLPLTRAVKGEKTDNIEMNIRNEQLSQEVYVSVNGRPLLDENGVSRGGVVVAHNITELKQTQIQLEQTVAKLENQTQLLEVVFNNMSDGVVAVDDKGRYVVFNQTAERMTGQHLESIDIQDAPERFGFFHPDQKTPFPADQLPLARALRGERTDSINIFMHNSKMQEGLHLSISARPLRNAQGVVTGGISVSRDVTKLKQAEAELQHMVRRLEEQSNLMESIFNSISDGVVVADEDSNFTMFNPSAEKIVGMGAVDTTPDHWSDDYGLFFPDRVTPFPSEELPLALALQGETSDNIEIFVRNPKVPDGVFISVSGRPIRDETGTDRGGVAVFRDVTHRVIAEEALTQAFAQGRLEIVETILHNIGNAINSVTVGVNVLQENIVGNQLIHRFSALADMVKAHQEDWVDFIKNDPKGQQVLPFMIALAADFNNQNERMIKTLERVGERVMHIIDIIRTQRSSNQPNMTRKIIGLQQTISSVVKLQQDSIDKRGIQVDFDCENAPQEIQIQESQFQQMLVNLLRNSIEAIDELIQSGGLNETPRIEIKAYTDEDFLYLDVTDNGIGITEQNLKLIFTAGYTTKQSGTGLGLHSSANFVIGSGGKIYPLSEGIGKGTTMRIMMRCSSILPKTLGTERSGGEA